ncbi:hypothetical protein Dimus_033325 [Dionaea muscipula]
MHWRWNETRRTTPGIFGPIHDPHIERVRRWNRAILLARGFVLAVDPLFFYALSIGRDGSPCLSMDEWVAGIVTVLRTCVDGVHLLHLWLHFRLAYVSRESLVVGCGSSCGTHGRSPLTMYGHSSASGLTCLSYFLSPRGHSGSGHITCHRMCIRSFHRVFVSSSVSCTKIDRAEADQVVDDHTSLTFLFSFLPKVYHSISLMRSMQKVTGYIFGTIWWNFGLNLIAYFIASYVVGGCWYILAIQHVGSCLVQRCQRNAICNISLLCSAECRQLSLHVNATGNPCSISGKSLCLDDNEPYNFGIYDSALPVIFSNAIVIKILYPISWGLFQLSTFGNNLTPTCHWSEVVFGICLVLEGPMLFTLLIGNIQVPLFHCLDYLILDNICDRVKPLIYSKDEKIMREGDPVQRMIFIVRGRIMKGPFLHRLPASSATFMCLKSTEAFGLDAYDLRYITEHFRYKFANEILKRTLRYHSSNWRTWGAVNMQLAWHRYVRRTLASMGQMIQNGEANEEHRLRQCVAIFMSLRPHDHLD